MNLCVPAIGTDIFSLPSETRGQVLSRTILIRNTGSGVCSIPIRHLTGQMSNTFFGDSSVSYRFGLIWRLRALKGERTRREESKRWDVANHSKTYHDDCNGQNHTWVPYPRLEPLTRYRESRKRNQVPHGERRKKEQQRVLS